MREPRPPDGRMALTEHLRELRNRLAISLLAIGACVVVVFVFWEPVFAFLREPYCRTTVGRDNCDLYALGIFEQFKVRLRVAMIGGVVLAAPVWLYQLGAFITPGLHRNERKYAAGFLVASLTLFVAGAVLAYLTISQGLNFLLQVGGEDVVTLVSIQSYLSFVTFALIAFGVAFEFPVIVTFLNMVGLFPVERMRRWRRGMVLGIFAAAALITPSQDPFTLLAMALPLYLLYELTIVLARVRERRARRRRAADPLATLGDDEISPIEPAAPVEMVSSVDQLDDEATETSDGTRSLRG